MEWHAQVVWWQVTYPELCSYVDRRGLEMQQRQLGSSRRHDITSLTDYTMALHDIVGNHTHTVASASVKATTPAKVKKNAFKTHQFLQNDSYNVSFVWGFVQKKLIQKMLY